MLIIDIAINTRLVRLTIDPAGIHCRSWDDAFVSSYRQHAEKRQTDGTKFTHRPKIRFFAPQWRLVAPIHVKLGTADWHVCPGLCTDSRQTWQGRRAHGSDWLCEISPQSGGVNGAPKISKISTI